MGTRLVTLCTGTRDPADPWRAHPDNGTPEAWRDLTASMETAIAAAEASDVYLGIEPELANVVSSAEAARRLIDEMKSPRLRIVIDAANLFETASVGRAAGHRQPRRRSSRRPYRHGARQGPGGRTATSSRLGRASSTIRTTLPNCAASASTARWSPMG